MYSDDPVVLELLSLLKAYNVRHVVIAPGSRHRAITMSLEQDKDFTLYSVVDERSAGFFALGLIQALNAPVATLCTSGTASINFGSSVVEAYYQKLPLCVLTPDRLPELLGQMEDQMFAQTNMFRDFTRYVATLKPVHTQLDRWFVNRVLNEALDSLTANGGGPIQINIPFLSHNVRMTVENLPPSRVIRRHRTQQVMVDWKAVAQRLQGKRVQIIWGQSPPPSPGLLEAFNAFTEAFDVVTLADHLSNLNHPNRIRLPLLYLRLPALRTPAFWPDIVITMGGNIVFQDNVNAIFRSYDVEHWRVDEDGEVSDPFRKLTDMFQMPPEQFFREAARASQSPSEHRYLNTCTELAANVPEFPQDVYGETGAIGLFLSKLPKNSVLHIANSAPMRMTQFFNLDPSIKVLANRGINGIDGSMSAAIGYSVASDCLNFLVIGDLSFFYDMNSLWIRHRPNNVRIILLNNEGGAVMHGAWGFSPQVGVHASATHYANARGWVESLGIRYVTATNFEELKAGLSILTDESTDEAVVLEIFTEKNSDIRQMTAFYSQVGQETAGAPTKFKLKQMAKQKLDQLGLLKTVKRFRT